MRSGLVLFLMCACFPNLAVAEPTEALRVGVVFPFTGTQARQGELGRAGIELARKELGAGLDFQVFYEDSQSDTKAAVSAFSRLESVEDIDVALTMGSPAAMALLPMVNRAKIPLLAMVVVSGYSVPDDFGFRLMGSAEQFGKRVLELLSHEMRSRRIAVIYVEDDYGTTYSNFFRSALGDSGALVASEAYLPGTADFRSQLLKIKATKPDAVVLASWAREAGLILKQAADVGLAPNVFACPSACDNPDLIAPSVSSPVPVVIVGSSSITTEKLKQRLKAESREEPTSVVLRFYDAVLVLKKAAADCLATGTAKSECLRKAIASTIGVEGSSYPIRFDKNGDIEDWFQLKVARDTSFVGVQIVDGQIRLDRE